VITQNSERTADYSYRPAELPISTGQYHCPTAMEMQEPFNNTARTIPFTRQAKISITLKMRTPPTIAYHFFSWTDSMDSPDCLPILLSISVFSLSTLPFSTVSCFRAVDLSYSCRFLISFRIASLFMSYRLL